MPDDPESTAPTGEPYVARYGPSIKTGLVLLISVIFVALAPFTGDWAVTISAWILFGGGGLVFALIVLSRKVALRVDREGVTLGGSPLRYAATTNFVPWRDIVAIVLWTQRLPRGQSMRYVGVQRKEGLSPLPGPGTGRLGHTIARSLVSHVPPEIVMASRAVNGWRLDRDRLATAVAEFAPGTPIHDNHG